MADEKSSSSSIKFGRSNTMALTESGWRISIKNADGTSDEVTIEPKLLEAGDDEDAGDSPKPSAALKIYLFIQYLLNATLAISIITIMALTLAKFNATKHVPGAWPKNPVTSPTFLMMIVSIVNCFVDSINLLVQCCGPVAIGLMASVVFKVRNVTGVIMALAPAAAAGFIGISTTTSNNRDLWSWSCSSGADQMTSVNSSGTICMRNQIAFGLQICQIVFQILSILIPAFTVYRPGSPSSRDSRGSKSMKDKNAAGAKTLDEAGQGLIDEASKTFQSYS